MSSDDMHAVDAPPAIDLAAELEADEDEDLGRVTLTQVNSAVRAFLIDFNTAFKERDASTIATCYFSTFPAMSSQFYSKEAWPELEDVAGLGEADPTFAVLYAELTLRYELQTGAPTFDRYERSWCAYAALLEHVSGGGANDVPVPNEWLYEGLMEMSYQFQNFTQYWTNLEERSEEEVEAARARASNSWTAPQVLRLLHSTVVRSGVREYLARERKGEVLRLSAAQSLGYFSLVALCRVHSLLGDFHTSLRVLEGIDLSRKGLFTRVAACHATLFYFVAYSYVRTRRYTDAGRLLATVLLLLARSKAQSRASSSPAVQRLQSRMLALLAIATSLSPGQRVDERVEDLMEDKYGDLLAHVQRGSESSEHDYEELFRAASPKFITSAVPTFDMSVNFNKMVQRVHLDAFMDEVRQQHRLARLRSFMKLYATISVDKLAGLQTSASSRRGASAPAGADAIARVRQDLLCYKHKMMQRTRGDGDVDAAPQHGSVAAVADVHFVVDGDVVQVDTAVAGARTNHYFMHEIQRFEEVLRELGTSA